MRFKKKFYIVPFFLFFCSFSVYAQTGKQIIVFNNTGKTKGKIYIAWYNKEADFTKDDRIFIGKTIDVNEKGSTSVSFENIASGTYAIAAFLDENGNGKMDTNLFGIPKEKYGFSNNVRPMMRAATFKEASFTVTKENNTIHIRLR